MIFPNYWLKEYKNLSSFNTYLFHLLFFVMFSELYELYAIIGKAHSDINNLGEKIRTIGNTQKEILNKINYLWRLETANMDAYYEILQVHSFPIRTKEALSEVEEKLCDTTYRKLLVNICCIFYKIVPVLLLTFKIWGPWKRCL